MNTNTTASKKTRNTSRNVIGRLNARMTREDLERIDLIAEALARKARGRKPTLTETLRVALKITASGLLAS